MGTIRVVNKRAGSKYKPMPGEVVIAVDRSNPVLGNPHMLKNVNDPAERDRVIAAYQRDYDADWERNGPMRKATEMIAERVKAGERVCCSCWCFPKPCHASCIEKRVQQILGMTVESQSELGI